MSLFKRKPLCCAEFVEHATGYLEGTLSKREHRRLEAHLQVCEPCRVYLEQLEQTLRAARNAKPEPLPSRLKDDLANVFTQWKGPL
jgi:predicted anti-sigma-YlaC factor YlaD